jgi:hypothetical protein
VTILKDADAARLTFASTSVAGDIRAALAEPDPRRAARLIERLGAGVHRTMRVNGASRGHAAKAAAMLIEKLSEMHALMYRPPSGHA